MHGMGGMEDLFDILGGGMGGMGGMRRGPRGPRKGDDVKFPLPVTLEEVFTGVTKKLRLTKNVLCAVCKG